MPLLLSHNTSLAFWYQTTVPRNAYVYAKKRELESSPPYVSDINSLRKRFPFLPEPYHLVVFNPSHLRKRTDLLNVSMHVQSCPLPPRSFMSIHEGIHVSTPELCFIQMAQTLDLISLIRAGFHLCSTFGLQKNNDLWNMFSRDPVTSKDTIGKYLDLSSGMRGAANAARALNYVLDRAASPREIDLALRLFLPQLLGGFGLPAPKLNYKVDLNLRSSSLTTKRFLVVDACWPDKKLALEYDSTRWHTDAQQLTHDAAKRSALEKLGFKVITVTQFQLNSAILLQPIAKEIASHLGKRLQIRSPKFRERQSLLFHHTSYQKEPYDEIPE